MLDDHPVLQDRLKALGVFSGIAISAVAGFELVIGGGLDFITPGAEIREIAPSSYVQVLDDFWTPRASAVTLTSTEPLFAGDDVLPTTDEDLAGGLGDEAAPDGGYPQGRSFEDIEADIQALYEESDPAAYVETSTESEYEGLAPAYPEEYADEPAPDETIDPKKQELELQELTAYESGLPS